MPAPSCSSTRGVFSGGYPGSLVDVIEYVTIDTTGDVTDFGDLTVARFSFGGNSNNIRSVSGGGWTDAASNVIDYVTIASTGDATDFGDMITAQEASDTMSNGHGGLA